MPSIREKIEHPHWGTLVVTRNSRARRIIMRARPDAIYITIPPAADNNEIEKALAAHGGKLKELQEKTSIRAIDENFSIEKPLFRLHTGRGNSNRIRLTGNNGAYMLELPSTNELLDEQPQQQLRRAVTAALQHRAKEILPQRLFQLAKEHGLKYRSVTIRDIKSRWGSCSNRSTISLSIYLVLLTQELIDYVLLHELCHTVEFNHSRRFWEMLDKVCGCDSKRLRTQLKSHKTYFI